MNGYFLALFIFVGGHTIVEGGGCSWSNEECTVDSDCCSGVCLLAHEGTDPRCTRGSISKSCVFDYHCKDGLECGKSYNCCSPYWENCVQHKDCCDTEKFVCRSVDGFVYKKCLYPAAAGLPSANVVLLISLFSLTIVFSWMDV